MHSDLIIVECRFIPGLSPTKDAYFFSIIGKFLFELDRHPVTLFAGAGIDGLPVLGAVGVPEQ